MPQPAGSSSSLHFLQDGTMPQPVAAGLPGRCMAMDPLGSEGDPLSEDILYEEDFLHQEDLLYQEDILYQEDLLCWTERSTSTQHVGRSRLESTRHDKTKVASQGGAKGASTPLAGGPLSPVLDPSPTADSAFFI